MCFSGMDREGGGKMKNRGPWTRLAAAVAVLVTLVVVTGGALSVAQGVGATPKASAAIPDQPRGVNFVVKSDIDSNFCIQSYAASSTQTDLQVQPCNGAVDAQRWAFAWTASGPLVSLGSNGQCWDANTLIGSPVAVVPCTFKSHERFVFTAAEQFQNVSGTRCLTVKKTGSFLAGGTAVLIDKCNGTTGQTWLLGH
jgi:hypothetical protein